MFSPLQKKSVFTGLLSLCLALTVSLSTSVSAQKDAPAMMKKSAKQAPSADEALTKKVNAAIARTKQLKNRGILAKSEAGVVTLSGKLKYAEHKQQAEQVAKGVQGVKQVTNNLEVDANSGGCSPGYHECCDISQTPQTCYCLPNAQPCGRAKGKK